MRPALLCAIALAAAPAAAQERSIQERTIQVVGRGKVSTAPDIALLDFWVAGEGRTPDEATGELAEAQEAVVQGLAAFLGGRTEITTSELLVIDVRDAKCDVSSRPRLSQGDCAVIGYMARVRGQVRTNSVAKAGTAVGLASRLGARDVRLGGFQLENNRTARQTALADAMADARSQAADLAAAAGQRLGPVLSVRDALLPGGSIGVAVRGAEAVPPPPPPPPVAIDIAPRPIDTTAQITVTYSLLP